MNMRLALFLSALPLWLLAEAEEPRHFELDTGIVKQPTQDCSGDTPTSIVGEWTLDTSRTGDETFGVSRVDRKQTVKITKNTFSTRLERAYEVNASYRSINVSRQHSVIELFDELGKGERLILALVPCGLRIESNARCTTAHCERGREETFEQLAKNYQISIEEIRLKSNELVPQEQTKVVSYYRPIVPEL